MSGFEYTGFRVKRASSITEVFGVQKVFDDSIPGGSHHEGFKSHQRIRRFAMLSAERPR